MSRADSLIDQYLGKDLEEARQRFQIYTFRDIANINDAAVALSSMDSSLSNIRVVIDNFKQMDKRHLSPKSLKKLSEVNSELHEARRVIGRSISLLDSVSYEVKKGA